MTNALEQAYASNAATPLLTVEFIHSALNDGVLRLVESNYDLTATLEDSSIVTFAKSGISTRLPDKNSDGSQSISIGIDNTSNLVWNEIKAVVAANRSGQERIICKIRPFLESDLSAPPGSPFIFTVLSSSINSTSAQLVAAYTPIPDTYYPRYRYYPTLYPGVKYA